MAELSRQWWGIVSVLWVLCASADAEERGGGPPYIETLSPEAGGTGGGDMVMMIVDNLTTPADTAVFFGGEKAEVEQLENRYLLCRTPPHAPGVVEVKIVNSHGSGLLPFAFTYQVPFDLFDLTFQKLGAGNEIKLTWGLAVPGDRIQVFRGSRQVASLEGDATEVTLIESCCGRFRFTLLLQKEGLTVDSEEVVVDLGTICWTPPEGAISGFYLYLAPAEGDPEQALPYHDPAKYTCDMGLADRVDLEALQELQLLEGGGEYYLAASSYLIDYPENHVSELTEVLTFRYEVALGDPWTSTMKSAGLPGRTLLP